MLSQAIKNGEPEGVVAFVAVVGGARVFVVVVARGAGVGHSLFHFSLLSQATKNGEVNGFSVLFVVGGVTDSFVVHVDADSFVILVDIDSFVVDAVSSFDGGYSKRPPKAVQQNDFCFVVAMVCGEGPMIN